MDFQNICQTVFISLIIIFLCHYFFYYLQASFTEPKVKDMINRPNEKYETIMKVVNSQDQQQDQGEIEKNNPIKTVDQLDMKNELNNFINEMTPGEINPDGINPVNSNNFNSPESESGLPIPSNNFDNQELAYSNNEPDSTPIDQLNATQ